MMDIPEKMTPEETVAALRVCQDSGTMEDWHRNADAILCAVLRFYGQNEVAEEYDLIYKCYA